MELLQAERDTIDMALAANVSFFLLPMARQAALVLLCLYLGAERLRRADNLWAAIASDQWGAAAQELRRIGQTPEMGELADALRDRG